MFLPLKRGEERALNKEENVLRERNDAHKDQSMDSQEKAPAPYVRRGKANRRIRKERMAAPTAGEDILKASDLAGAKLVIRDGILPDLDGAA